MSKEIVIPKSLGAPALKGLEMIDNGLKGGTPVGWHRAKQLAYDDKISIEDVRKMRSFFARHKYTSYPGYKRWVRDGKPTSSTNKNEYRGAIAWLIWGGDPAEKWVKSEKISKILQKR